MLENDLNYTLRVSSYSSDANFFVEDSLGLHDGAAFSTKDKDNDLSITENCALSRETAGW